MDLCVVQFGDGNFGVNPDCQSAGESLPMFRQMDLRVTEPSRDLTSLLQTHCSWQVMKFRSQERQPHRFQEVKDKQSTDQLRVVSPRLFAAGDRAVSP